MLATLCCLLWGSAYPAIKIGYDLLGITPSNVPGQMLFAGWRFLMAGLFLLILSAWMRKPVFSLSPEQGGQVALLGLTQTAIRYVFFYIGLAHASGVKSSIMNATGVFFSVVLAHFIYANDRLSSRKTMGCLIGFLGVVVVNLSGGASLTFEFSLLGEGFVTIAAFVLAAASIYGKRVSRRLDPLIMTGWQLFIGGGVLAVVGLAGGAQLEGLNAGSGALLFYMALLSSVAFAVWSLLLKHNPVGLIAAFNFLVPVFGSLFSAALLGESLIHWSNLAALVLVCAGIWFVTRQVRVHRAIVLDG